MIKVGVGVITIQRRALRAEYLNLIDRPTTFHVHVDTERRGPGYGRNQCIKTLYDAGCDLVVVFDDDCYPVRRGWQSYLVSQLEKYGIHAATMAHRKAAGVVYSHGDLEYREYAMGCFVALTRRAIETVGYFNLEYGLYAYEDPDYLMRLRRSGLNGRQDGDPGFTGLYDMIFSEDAAPPELRSADFNPSANLSVAEKEEWIARNKDLYYGRLNTAPVYSPYTP